MTFAKKPNMTFAKTSDGLWKRNKYFACWQYSMYSYTGPTLCQDCSEFIEYAVGDPNPPKLHKACRIVTDFPEHEGAFEELMFEELMSQIQVDISFFAITWNLK